MAEKYRFFDAVLQEDGITYDREYDAQEFTDYFKALVTTGVMKGIGSQLAVTANGQNMQTSIDTGIAFLLGRYYENDSPLTLTHDTETLSNNRIDCIVIRMDLSTEARYVKAFVKKGVASPNPVPPSLIQGPNLYEISVAQVKIIGGQTFIAIDAVTDERGTDIICPWAGSNILPNFNNDMLAELVGKVNNLEGFADTINPSIKLKTFYVNGTKGTDSPDKGGSADTGAFKTINYAIKQVKKMNVGNVVIDVAPGTYNEDVTITNFYGGKISLIGSGSTTIIKSVACSNSSTIQCMSFNLLERIVFSQVGFFDVGSVNKTVTSDYYHVLDVRNSKGYAYSCNFSGASSPGCAGVIANNSELLLTGITGGNNYIGVYSIASTVRIGSGTIITGTTPTKVEAGGQILA